MSSPRDVLQLKTDAELRFFVENPGYYQAELVDAARRELLRRGPAALAGPAATPVVPAAAGLAPATLAAPALPAPGVYSPIVEKAPARRPWLLLGSVAAVVVVAGLGFWSKTPSSPPQETAGASPKPSYASSPKVRPLETAVAAPLPTYDAEGDAEKALALVPAAEQKNTQLANQYRAISRRFWAAQNPSAHLIRQVQRGQANPAFVAQAKLGLGHDFDRTQVYSYSFGPGMADHLARMRAIAQYQREALGELTNDYAAERPVQLDDDRSLAHQQEIPRLLAPLEHRTGPIKEQL